MRQRGNQIRPAGRPRLNLDGAQVVELRDGARLSWRTIAKQLSAGATTVRRAYHDAKRLGDTVGQNPERGCSTAEDSTEKETA